MGPVTETIVGMAAAWPAIKREGKIKALAPDRAQVVACTSKICRLRRGRYRQRGSSAFAIDETFLRLAIAHGSTHMPCANAERSDVGRRR